MLSPQGSYYSKLAEECVQYGTSVELFMCADSYVDVATIGQFVSTTGGQLHYYPQFMVCIIKYFMYVYVILSIGSQCGVSISNLN